MTRKKAIEIFFKYNLRAREDLKKLLLYKEGMSNREFSDAVKCGIGNAYKFLANYGIHCNRETSLRKNYIERWKKLALKWDNKLTLKGNAIRLKINPITASHIAATLNLDYSHHQNLRPYLSARLRRIIYMKKRGIKDSEIARFFNCSREYIRQLSHRAKLFSIK